MTSDPLTTNRIAVLVALATAVPGKTMGRTAAMKLAYFLQELYGVRLGYDFRLHTYGPYDEEVLSDLATATMLQALSEKMVTYSKGYGYEIRPGPRAEPARAAAADWLSANRSTLDQVVREFGAWSASDLELGSTVLFVDRELRDRGDSATHEDIASRVRKIKPHFSERAILARVEHFHAKGWLLSVPSRVPGQRT
jgi:hypothetical protein